MMTSLLQQTVIGKVVKREFGKGSNKHRIVNAVFTDDGRDLIIRHFNTTAFQDTQFDALEGKRVQLTGEMSSYVLIVDSAIELESTKEQNNEQ